MLRTAYLTPRTLSHASLLGLTTLAALGLNAPSVRADVPVVFATGLNPADVTLTATGPLTKRSAPVSLLADGGGAGALTASLSSATNESFVADRSKTGFSDPGTFGTIVVGYATGSGGAPFTLTFDQPVTEFGLYVGDRTGGGAAGTFNFSITGSDGSVTPLAVAFTDETPVFFGARRSLSFPTFTITSVAVTETVAGVTTGEQHFDIGPVKALTAAPEPPQTAALGLGSLALAGLILKARRRTASAS